MFDWYTGFEDFLNDGIAESCYWIGYKKSINEHGLDDEVLAEGMDLIRKFVNDRASLYRFREELVEQTLERAKADNVGDQVKVVKAEARIAKIKPKALVTVFKILEGRQEFDDWLAMEGIEERPREKSKANGVDYDF